MSVCLHRYIQGAPLTGNTIATTDDILAVDTPSDIAEAVMVSTNDKSTQSGPTLRARFIGQGYKQVLNVKLWNIPPSSAFWMWAWKQHPNSQPGLWPCWCVGRRRRSRGVGASRRRTEHKLRRRVPLSCRFWRWAEAVVWFTGNPQAVGTSSPQLNSWWLWCREADDLKVCRQKCIACRQVRVRPGENYTFFSELEGSQCHSIHNSTTHMRFFFSQRICNSINIAQCAEVIHHIHDCRL